MFTRIILINLLLFFQLKLTAQDFHFLQGKVSDANTGEYLPFCSVYIKGKSVGTVTNLNGEFKLNVLKKSGDTLVISHVGFHNFLVPVNSNSNSLDIKLKEAVVNLDEISVTTHKLSASDIFKKALEKIKNQQRYPRYPFKLNGFYREIHTSEDDRTGVLECAVDIYDDDLTRDFKNIEILQFRKVYDRHKNTDQFIETKEGHNHLLLLLNNGINFIPLANQYKKTIWKLPLEIEKVTYYNDRLIYILSNKSYGRELLLYIDADNYSVYKNELILEVDEQDHDLYAWRKVNPQGEKCGAILDHQSYEYREVDGKLFPHYYFRRFDFRCYDLTKNKLSSKAGFSTELLINNVEQNKSGVSTDRFRKKKGLINRKEPYDSSFWQYFNDIQEVSLVNRLINEDLDYEAKITVLSKEVAARENDVELKIGDHGSNQFNRADTLFGELSPALSCYNVNYYKLEIEVDPDREWIKGVSNIHFTMVEPSDKIRIDLFEQLAIDSIIFKGTNLVFERDLDAVYITFPRTLKRYEKVQISVVYEGHPLNPDFRIWASGFFWQEDDSGNSFSQTLCQGYGAKAWFPVKNHLSDEPDSSSVVVTVPENIIAVSNGKLIKTELTEGKKTFHWQAKSLINNYNIAVHLGNYISSDDVYYGKDSLEKLDLQYYFLREDSTLAMNKLSMVPKMMGIYEKYFGTYPFVADGLKLVQSPYPMEHQSCIAVGKYFDEQLILHETAHEWWGNSVSCTDNAELWIHEAFATYAESLFVEDHYGYEAGQRYINAMKGQVQNRYPVQGKLGVNHIHYDITDMYTKGAIMLNELRRRIDNDEIWFSILKGIQQDFRYSSITTTQVIDYINVKIGQNFDDFFDQWLYQTDAVVVE